MIQIHVTDTELENSKGSGGVEIIIPGTAANPQEETSCPVFIEKYEGVIRVIVWNGEQDPTIIPLTMKKDT